MTEKKKHAEEENPAVAEEEAAARASAGETPAEPGADSGPEAEAAESPELLRDELERARAQADEYLEGWKRTQADLVNYRKRVERDAADARLAAAGQAAARWFPVLDDFERALKELPGTQNLEQWAGGIGLIYRKGLAALEAEGITPIEAAEGALFDPSVHEAVTRETCPDKQDGEILEVVHRGYQMGDRVLRPAKVRVACKPEGQ
jgi:molecular chaperone GrpE